MSRSRSFMEMKMIPIVFLPILITHYWYPYTQFPGISWIRQNTKEKIFDINDQTLNFKTYIKPTNTFQCFGLRNKSDTVTLNNILFDFRSNLKFEIRYCENDINQNMQNIIHVKGTSFFIGWYSVWYGKGYVLFIFNEIHINQND